MRYSSASSKSSFLSGSRSHCFTCALMHQPCSNPLPAIMAVASFSLTIFAAYLAPPLTSLDPMQHSLRPWIHHFGTTLGTRGQPPRPWVRSATKACLSLHTILVQGTDIREDQRVGLDIQRRHRGRFSRHTSSRQILACWGTVSSISIGRQVVGIARMVRRCRREGGDRVRQGIACDNGRSWCCLPFSVDSLLEMGIAESASHFA
ncbi:hypothetical protein BCR44DRAFT_185825 [Catenaria anguillulae PL171]|uniref:Uncharacterized protein n=1 Tax=Catenaria anguillulae PL171 TaxID=765915 RepID=A0A1Y2H891_9FUNG|nr:hypothetical protein BCR44DRAFT_185825 [Catenaria anguillulae PL171]